MALLFTLNTSYGYFINTKAKQHLSKRIGQYVPPVAVNEMLRHPEALSMEDDDRDRSARDTDVRGLTTIFEGLESSELPIFMDEFLTPLARVVRRHFGTIDTHMGECTIATLGALLQVANLRVTR